MFYQLLTIFKRDPKVYFWTVIFAIVPAFFDMIAAFPAVVSQSHFGLAITNLQHQYLPLANVGLDWLVPALVGLGIGLCLVGVKSYFLAGSTQQTR